ncbi:enoyl-CoA hydratase [Lutibaculum baratangense]|nr:enoyl-CoA hydratase [Lutibaculum baratangense]
MSIDDIEPRQAAGAESEVLLVERDGGIATLTLNRPKARNALSEDLLDALSHALLRVEAHRDVSVVVLAGAPPAFCAGHDLREMNEARNSLDRGRAAFERLFTKCSNVMQQIVHLRQPVIAAVDGIATAAGCQLVASCDMAVAGDQARFATPGVNIGLFCSTPMVALTRNVPRKHAMEMLLTGEMVGAEKAERLGLVNRVVPSGTALAAATDLARQVAAKSPLVLRIGKEAFYEQLEMPLSEAYRHTARVMTENMLARDAEEGIGAFIEKREARWTGE